MDLSEPSEFPVNGVLDLHTFDPSDVRELIPDYISECLKRDIYSIRIIHGKGTGVLRRIVHSVLAGIPEVRDFRTADERGGGWGATLVELERG
jgi:DNA-nicking Smr family endonuclease